MIKTSGLSCSRLPGPPVWTWIPYNWKFELMCRCLADLPLTYRALEVYILTLDSNMLTLRQSHLCSTGRPSKEQKKSGSITRMIPLSIPCFLATYPTVSECRAETIQSDFSTLGSSDAYRTFVSGPQAPVDNFARHSEPKSNVFD